MAQVPIIMPQLGESIAEATIVSINVKPGDKVAPDQEIIEVETNKAVMGVTTPCAGEIAKIEAQVKETYPIGAVLGYIEASEKDAARFADTHGYHIDSGRDMSRWRAWVIDAFNKNLPFDRFAVEQLAGDLLPNPTF